MHQPQADASGIASAAYAPATPGSAATTPVRRSALQAITNKEARAGQAGAEPRPSAAALTAEQQREQKARVAEWIIAYRKAFPSFVFYFEGVDEFTVHRLSAPIRSLGGKVETFFSAQTVTHVIVERPIAAGDESAAACSHVVSLAWQFQLKIWDVNKLEKRVLGMLLPGYSSATATAAQGPSVLSAKRKLSEAFSAEKLYAMRHKTFEGASVAHCVDFYYFKYFYLLVEDATHLHRPALLEDFRPPEPGRDPPWPKLYMVPTGRCPFVQYEDPTTSSKGSDTDADDNKENVTPEPEPTMPVAQPPSKTPASRLHTPRRAAHDAENYLATPTRPSRGAARTQCLVPAAHGLPAAEAADSHLIMDSTASGIARSHTVTSTSTAFNLGVLDPVMQRSLLQNLNGGRVTHLSRLEQPAAAAGARIAGQSTAVRSRGRAPPVPRTAKPRVAARRPAVARPGYCENCRVKFADMLEHVRSPEHQRFAANDSNWTALDAVIDRVQRPPCRSEDTPRSAYALSSDEGSVVAAAPRMLDDGPSLDASWASNPSTHALFCSAPASAHLLASGRLSTEALDPAEGPADARGTEPAGLATGSGVAANSVYLTYSTTSMSLRDTRDNSELPADDSNGAADSAPQAVESSEGPLGADGSHGLQPACMATPARTIEALVSSLETPQFRSAYDDPATLVDDELARRKKPKHTTAADATDHALHLATPTRPRPWQMQLPASPAGGATLVQPDRVKHKHLIRDENDAPPPASDRLAMAGRLGRMLHSASGTP
ncbi:Cdc7p-Dbf4p kinase complex regulatory subunit [Coemansia nantahalensis]|uniref:Cdc7p-Dbf4p kinase complex regulatory subunit n=1 Tax=Coemansia nantahalensis TaxID=2789366 RepID=A0ACC1JYC1_9FUNG|nr:Cdc7p-Dbf4p kinase complex regulatory subunit [Coemansia nantahalensis]